MTNDSPIDLTLTRADLTQAMVHAGFGSKRQAGEFIAVLFDWMSTALSAGEAIHLKGFGHFEVVPTAERTGHNPKTGEPIPIPAGRRVRFKPSKLLLKNGEVSS